MKRAAADGDVSLAFCEKRRTIYDNIFSLISWCRALGAHYEKEHKKKLALQIIPRKFRLYTQEYLDSRPSEADQLLLDLRGALSYFDQHGYQRSAHQRKFHESMIAACIRYVVSTLWCTRKYTHLPPTPLSQAHLQGRILG